MSERDDYKPRYFAMPAITNVNVFTAEMREKFRISYYKKFGLRPIDRIMSEWRDKRYVWQEQEQEQDVYGRKMTGTTWHVLSDEEMAQFNLPEYPSEEEIEQFRNTENKWVAEQILYKFGWNDFVKFCTNGCLGEEFIDKHTPCESQDRQCNLLCPKAKECLR